MSQPQQQGLALQVGTVVEPLHDGRPGVVIVLTLGLLSMRLGPLTPEDAEAVMKGWQARVDAEVANVRRITSGLVIGQSGNGKLQLPGQGLPPGLKWPPGDLTG